MKKLITRILITINVVIILAMMVTGFAYYLNPVTWGWLAEAGYAFPLPLICNMLMMVVWVCFRLRYVIIPFVGMLICYVPVMKYTPINVTTEAPENHIRVMSYNTLNLGYGILQGEGKGYDEAMHEFFEYVKSCNADIICLQEALLNDFSKSVMEEVMGKDSLYVDSLKKGDHCAMMLISRYPIKKKECIEYESAGNHSGAFTLDVNGKEVIVINNHLETNAFSIEEKTHFSDVVHGNQGKKALVGESKFVLTKLTDAAKKRAPQAQAVASYIRMHEGRTMIVCGDFNDIPLSYANHTISNGLTDCFAAAGNGPGFSFHHNAMRVRIDNIMVSSDITPYRCWIDSSVEMSDHYPIICDISLPTPLPEPSLPSQPS